MFNRGKIAVEVDDIGARADRLGQRDRTSAGRRRSASMRRGRRSRSGPPSSWRSCSSRRSPQFQGVAYLAYRSAFADDADRELRRPVPDAVRLGSAHRRRSTFLRSALLTVESRRSSRVASQGSGRTSNAGCEIPPSVWLRSGRLRCAFDGTEEPPLSIPGRTGLRSSVARARLARPPRRARLAGPGHGGAGCARHPARPRAVHHHRVGADRDHHRRHVRSAGDGPAQPRLVPHEDRGRRDGRGHPGHHRRHRPDRARLRTVRSRHHRRDPGRADEGSGRPRGVGGLEHGAQQRRSAGPGLAVRPHQRDRRSGRYRGDDRDPRRDLAVLPAPGR